VLDTRPRRAARAPLTVRVARFAVPGVLLGLATTGVVAAATGPHDQGASAPAVTVASSPAAVVGDRSAPVSRGQSAVRPSLSPAAVAQAEAAEAAQAARARKAAKKAAEAAAKARADKEAAREKAAAAKAARLAAARRAAAEKKALAGALQHLSTRYTRVDLNVRSAADPGSTLLTVLDARAELSVTPVVRDGWRYVSHRGHGAWVKDQYLVQQRPKAPAAASGARSGGISGSACKGGSAVESGLTPDAVRVHRAICARFPSVKAYGGVRADSLPEHPAGRALDAMVSSTSTGWEIARWVRANAKQLGVSQVLFAQHIWTVQRGSEGWRTFPDRGSVTANHFDHVHVTVYGHSGG